MNLPPISSVSGKNPATEPIPAPVSLPRPNFDFSIKPAALPSLADAATGKRKIDAVDEDSGSFVINKRRLTEVASPIVNPLADSFAIRRSIQGVERNRLSQRQPTMMKAPVIVESQLMGGP